MGYAVCTLVQTDNDIYSAIQLGRSLSLSNPSLTRVCMVHGFIRRTTKQWRELLLAFHSIRDVSRASKWECLSLVEYTKVLYLHHACRVTKSLASLFILPTPAASFDWQIAGKNIYHGHTVKRQSVTDDRMLPHILLISPAPDVKYSIRRDVSSSLYNIDWVQIDKVDGLSF